MEIGKHKSQTHDPPKFKAYTGGLNYIFKQYFFQFYMYLERSHRPGWQQIRPKSLANGQMKRLPM